MTCLMPCVVSLFLVALAARLCLSCSRFPRADGGRVVVLRGFPAPLADCFRRGAGHLQQEDYRGVAERIKMKKLGKKMMVFVHGIQKIPIFAFCKKQN